MEMRAIVALAACAVLATSVVAPAQAAGSADPVVVSPSDGSEVALGYNGPVIVDFSNAADGTYSVEVVGHSGDRALHTELLGAVAVDGDGTTQQWALTDSLDKPGQYALHVAGNCSPERCANGGSSSFTVGGGQAPTILGPRRVHRQASWTLSLDWSRTPIGIYDIVTVAPNRTRTTHKYAYSNFEDLTLDEISMNPLSRAGWHTIEFIGVETTDPAYRYSYRIQVVR